MKPIIHLDFVSITGLCLLLLCASTASAAESRCALTQIPKININQASSSELEKLPGVGPKMAERILAFRKKRPFTRVGDLRRIKGIGPKKFLKLKDFVEISTVSDQDKVSKALHAKARSRPAPLPNP